MPKLKENALPSYRLHKQSGQAIVTLSGRDVLLGLHDTPASRAQYRLCVSEWLANGRRLPQGPPEMTISMLVEAYRQHVESYYRHADGTPTGEADNIRQAIRPLRKVYGASFAAEFGPLKLKTIRELMIHPADGQSGWTRKSINKQINRIRQMFKWAVESELIPASVHYGLKAVAALKAGRTEAEESEPVRPVPEAYIDPVANSVSKQIAAMIRLQLLTGARPGEICLMRAVDIDRAAKVWIFRPHAHKTSHHGHTREIRIGPRAQKLLEPFLTKLDLSAVIFSPADAEANRRESLRSRRKTPLNRGNRSGTNRTRNPKRAIGERYSVSAYRRAIVRGCDLAFPPPPNLARLRIAGVKGSRWETESEWKNRLGEEKWRLLIAWRCEHRWHPHQLRHNAATRLRREHGVEFARIILGHRHISATEIYAEADSIKATDIMERVG